MILHSFCGGYDREPRTIKQCVQEGLGVAVVSEHAVQDESRLGLLKVFYLSGFEHKQTFYFVNHKNRVLSQWQVRLEPSPPITSNRLEHLIDGGNGVLDLRFRVEGSWKKRTVPWGKGAQSLMG